MSIQPAENQEKEHSKKKTYDSQEKFRTSRPFTHQKKTSTVRAGQTQKPSHKSQFICSWPKSGTAESVFYVTTGFCSNTFHLETIKMKRSTLTFLGFALLFVAALPLHAQDGCLSSPENPTAILALVGSAGAFCATIRTRIKARRRSSR